MFEISSNEKCLELNFRETQAHLTHCVVKARFSTSTRKKDDPQSVHLFRKLGYVVSSILTRLLHLSPRIMILRVLALMRILSCA